uniref:Uncharacterized protein n=1 Tax=Setaria viridis TaxID=4556 RepID=A0A4U6VPC7_SETVI|nr:hypothetical protein SEVIR_2G075250v2 [Setaria viridis]
MAKDKHARSHTIHTVMADGDVAGQTVPAPVAVLSTRGKDSFPAVDTEMQTVSSCELRCKQLQSSPTRIRLTTSPERSMKRISPLEKWTPAIERTGVAGRVGLGEVRLGGERPP